MPSSTFFFPQKCRVFFGTPIIISECLFVETFLIQEAAKRTESSKFPFPASSSFLVEKKNRRFVVVLFDDDDARFRIGAIWTTKNGLEYSPVRNPNKSHKVVASESVPSSFSTKANASTPRTPPTRRRLSLALSLSLSPQKKKKKTTTTTAFVGVETHRRCDVREIYSRRLVPFLALFEYLFLACHLLNDAKKKKKKMPFQNAFLTSNNNLKKDIPRRCFSFFFRMVDGSSIRTHHHVALFDTFRIPAPTQLKNTVPLSGSGWMLNVTPKNARTVRKH